ncbi:uncharacterized protein L3040_007401 [Drepanopeziza brunnea f. sp. 'multigermtubi']|uniref:uncharacterized protein n=1 Tax=Drepanopeziza brunnea f. sp. 'multigermtubi' TaxID=698441 RepID=UPI0023A0255F|nr:hypothetical protein L3040_007401 [Drepanopeziza brunnea f. sp. 'multigermtubi']
MAPALILEVAPHEPSSLEDLISAIVNTHQFPEPAPLNLTTQNFSDWRNKITTRILPSSAEHAHCPLRHYIGRKQVNAKIRLLRRSIRSSRRVPLQAENNTPEDANNNNLGTINGDSSSNSSIVNMSIPTTSAFSLSRRGGRSATQLAPRTPPNLYRDSNVSDRASLSPVLNHPARVGLAAQQVIRTSTITRTTTTTTRIDTVAPALTSLVDEAPARTATSSRINYAAPVVAREVTPEVVPAPEVVPTPEAAPASEAVSASEVAPAVAFTVMPQPPTPPPKDAPRAVSFTFLPDLVSGAQLQHFFAFRGALSTPNFKRRLTLGLKQKAVEKELPAKPVLCRDQPPERTGLTDANDSAAKRRSLISPPPRRSYIPPRTSSRPLGGPFVKNARVVPQLPARSGFSPTARVVPAIRASLGHAANYQSRSPTEREPAASVDHILSSASRDPKPQKLEGVSHVNALNSLPEESNAKEVNVSGDKGDVADDGVSSPKLSPARSDGGRRFAEYGCGPSIRFAPDAHEKIMGYSRPTASSGSASRDSVPSVSSRSGAANGTNPSGRLPPTSRQPIKTSFNEANTPVVTSRFNKSADLKAKVRKNAPIEGSRIARPVTSSNSVRKTTPISNAKAIKRKPVAVAEVKKSPEVKRVSQGIVSRVSNLFGRRRIKEQTDPKRESSKSNSKEGARAANGTRVTRSGLPVANAEPAVEPVTTTTDTKATPIVSEVKGGYKSPKIVINEDPAPSSEGSTEEAMNKPEAAPASSATMVSEEAAPVAATPVAAAAPVVIEAVIAALPGLRAIYEENDAAAVAEDLRAAARIAALQALVTPLIDHLQGITDPRLHAAMAPVARSFAGNLMAMRRQRMASVEVADANQETIGSVVILLETVAALHGVSWSEGTDV